MSDAHTEPLRAALADVRSGRGRCRILCVGDSTTRGQGSGGGQHGLIDAQGGSWPTLFAERLRAEGVPASSQSFWGAGAGAGLGVSLSEHDPRIEADWIDTATPALGGGLLAPGSGAPLCFTPTEPVDTVEIHFGRNWDNGSLRVQVGGEALGPSLSCTGPPGYGAATYRLPVRTPRIEIAPTEWAWLMGVLAYDSAHPAVDVLNAGWGGASARLWTWEQDGLGPLKAIAAVAPDHTIVALGINDWRQGRSPEAYGADLDRIVATARAMGSVTVLAPFPSLETPLGVQQRFVAVARRVAEAHDALFWRSPDFDGVVLAPEGTLFDGVHRTRSGYDCVAAAMVELHRPLLHAAAPPPAAADPTLRRGERLDRSRPALAHDQAAASA